MAKKSLGKSQDAHLYDACVSVIQEARVAGKVGQDKLSVALGESRAFMYKSEAMQRRVDVVEFYRIANALGLDPVELFARFVAEAKKSEKQVAKK